MGLKEDLEWIARQEGFGTVTEFVNDFIVTKRHTFHQLTKHIETKHQRYYTRIWVYRVVRPLLNQRPQPKYTMPKAPVTPAGFKRERTAAVWDAKAQGLGYASAAQAFSLWQGGKAELARALGASPQLIQARLEEFRRGKEESI